jgi:hypothetical protein
MEREIETLSFDKEESSVLYLQLYANPVVNFEKHFG